MNTINQGASSGEGRAALVQLAERVEAATGPGYPLDAAIWCALNGVPLSEKIVADFEVGRQAPRFTASIDAAMTLTFGSPEGVVRAVVATAYQRWSEGELTAGRLARCIVAAALKARAAQGDEPCR